VRYEQNILNFMSELGNVKYEEILAIKMPLVEACIKSAKRNGGAMRWD
jgi:hypothetical protein